LLRTLTAFRKEQKRIENAGPNFKERINILTSAAYDSHLPYKTFRSIEHADVAGTGIEIVLVVPTIVPERASDRLVSAFASRPPFEGSTVGLNITSSA
jgi:hypothetical protein